MKGIYTKEMSIKIEYTLGQTMQVWSTATPTKQHQLHTYCSAQVDSAFHPAWDDKMTISLMAE